MKNQATNGEHGTDRDVKKPFAQTHGPNNVYDVPFTTVQGKARSFKPKNLRAHLVNGILTLALVAGFVGATAVSFAAADLKAADSKPADSKPEEHKSKAKATSNGSAEPKAAKKESSGRFVPFHGKLESVDASGKSIKIGDKTFQVLPTTKITKDGVKPGTLEDAKVGESIGGAYWEENGSYQLHSLRLGPKPEKKTATRKR